MLVKVGRNLESVKKNLQYMYEIGLGTPSARSGKWNLPLEFIKENWVILKRNSDSILIDGVKSLKEGGRAICTIN